MAQVSIGSEVEHSTRRIWTPDPAQKDKNEQSGDTSISSSLLSLNSYTIIVKIQSKTYPLSPVSFISVIAWFRFFGRGEGVCTQAISVKV